MRCSEHTFVVLARERRAGAAFDSAWDLAIGELKPRGRDGADEMAAIQETREAWRRAYDREPPTPAETAAGRLVDLLVADG